MSRLFGTLGIVLLVASVLWWGLFYGALANEVGGSVMDVYSDTIECFVYTSDNCAAANATAAALPDFSWPAYQPIVLWVAVACLLLAIIMPRDRRA